MERIRGSSRGFEPRMFSFSCFKNEFHFHRGPDYAATVLGYDGDELSALPESTTASFAGIGNPLAIGPIHPGETVLDIGCGAGMDLLLAAKRVGPEFPNTI